MPRFGPIKRKDLIYYLKQLGFDGPYPTSKHEIMWKGTITVTVPNPHKSDISRNLLAQILREAGIDRDEWEQL